MISSSNLQVVLSSRPADLKDLELKSHFSCCEAEYPLLGEDDVIIQTLYLNMDPAVRCRMNDSASQYYDPWILNETVEGMAGVGVIAESSSEAYKPGQIVEAMFGWPWKKYFSANACEPALRLSLKRCDDYFVRRGELTFALNCLGMTGLTALLSLQEGARLHPGDVCVVSDAAGPLGSITASIAKLMGCSQVIGICDNDKECSVATSCFGFGAALNVNEGAEIVSNKLKQLCPQGVSIYLDNSAGSRNELYAGVNDAIILQIKTKGRVLVMDHTSRHNACFDGPPPVLGDQADDHVDMEEIYREKFIPLAHNDEGKWEDALEKLTYWMRNEKIKPLETIYNGIENCSVAFQDMMCGNNMGTTLICVSAVKTELG